MIPQNILVIKSRSDFREWLIKNSPTEKECCIAVKRGKTPPEDSLWYLDAVEEALCFGWIDSTERGRAVCPDLNAKFVIIPEIVEIFKAHPKAWSNFQLFPKLYQRVRIDNIQRKIKINDLFKRRLQKLIEASERGEMIGDWHDCGRLLDY